MTEIIFAGHKSHWVRVTFNDGHVENYDKNAVYDVDKKRIAKILMNGNATVLISDYVQILNKSEVIIKSQVDFNIAKIEARYDVAEQLEMIKMNQERQKAIDKQVPPELKDNGHQGKVKTVIKNQDG